MGIAMDNEEFESLWTRIATKSTETVSTFFLFKKLGLLQQDLQECERPNTVKNKPRTAELEDLIYTLKAKLNEGCKSLLQDFLQFDKEKEGLVSRTSFRHVLANVNIHMNAIDLEHLLARINLRRKDGTVDYVRFVEKLQSRSNLSLFQNMLDNVNRTHHDRGPFTSSSEGMTAYEAESRLLEITQGPFLKLLEAFRKVASLGKCTLEEFKEIIEKTFQIQLNEHHLCEIANMFGEPENDSIHCMKFLALFQERPVISEIKEEVERFSSAIKIKYRLDRVRYNESFKGDLSRYGHAQKPRTLKELRWILCNLLQSRFRFFCKVFINVCRNEDCTADKEKMDSILQSMNVILLPTELEKLWCSLPVSYPIEAISLHKLIRHCSKLKNMKNLGFKEDSHLTLIMTKLKYDIIKQWNEVKSILKDRDPNGTGQVPFRDVYALFMTLNFNVRLAEIDKLCLAFDRNMDGNFHYLHFLKFYIKKKSR
nr:PREDICTED: uncharacterized protein LOC106702721 isoform X1 [Latimeria chalumnae]|eukprot:XP_014341241.1 PREDICTED: uncharacterized protein LOC106702721 isoform X1 [Latimeria chalumnae]